MKDTIAAISTALGVGAISIVRVSGSDAIEVVNKIFKGTNLTKVDSHTINYGYIVSKDKIIDEVLVSVMKAPNTFTCEDVVEINCHGGIATTNKVLELLLINGARLAEPGEFTKRAFLNGRIDLAQAESISDLISAKTDKARDLSINGLEGKLSEIIRSFRQQLLELLANIEVNIDYPEYEDIEEVTNKDLKEHVKNIRKNLEKVVEESENGQIVKNGIRIAIVGRPNVGKSSILNRILGEEKAIVTDIEGTTRDIVEGEISLDGILIRFIDTAGIREAKDIVEKIGIEKSLKEIERADLVMMVLNNNEKLTKEDKKMIKDLPENHIIVINKCDLSNKLDSSNFNKEKTVFIDTVTIEGTNNLKDKIKEIFNFKNIETKDLTYLSNARQIALAKESLQILTEIEIGLKNEVPVDMIEIDIKRIWEKLGEIIGETYTEELIDQLFKQFCLGK